MCQPGRPAPQGESHSGSPGFDRFQPYLEDLGDLDQHPERRELLLNRYRNALFNVDHHVDRLLTALREELVDPR